MEKIVVYGAGGHAGVVLDAIEKEGKYQIVGLIDDQKPPGEEVLGHRVLGDASTLTGLWTSGVHKAIVAIGDNLMRRDKSALMVELGFELVSTIHPWSTQGRGLQLGRGSMILAGTVLDPQVTLGEGVIINDMAGVGHGTTIGRFTHLGPCVACGAELTIGENTFIGMRTTILSGIRIGSNVFIGAGSLVTKEIPDNRRALGSPARLVS